MVTIPIQLFRKIIFLPLAGAAASIFLLWLTYRLANANVPHRGRGSCYGHCPYTSPIPLNFLKPKAIKRGSPAWSWRDRYSPPTIFSNTFEKRPKIQCILGPVGITSPNLSTWCAASSDKTLGADFWRAQPLKLERIKIMENCYLQ